MNQKHNLVSGISTYRNHQLFQNIGKRTEEWASGKIKSANGIFFKKEFDNQILNSLPESILEKLFAYTEKVNLSCNEYIYSPDDPIRFIYFPETAVISEFQILEDGKTIEVVMTGKEGFTGIASLFNSDPPSNWTQTSVSGAALRIDFNLFQEEFYRNTAFQKVLFNYFNSYIGQISQRLICNNFHMIEERLCCWFLMIQDRCSKSKFSLTQEQIAFFLGVHRPSITLIMQSLRDKNIIDYARGKIIIKDRYQLQNFACSCYNLN